MNLNWNHVKYFVLQKYISNRDLSIVYGSLVNVGNDSGDHELVFTGAYKG